MNLAIVGSSGYIAGGIKEYYQKIGDVPYLFGRGQEADCNLELTEMSCFDFSKLDGLDFIVFTAAVSGPDQCARDFANSWQINVDGTMQFIKAALDRDCRVLFLSSDAVYGDISGKIYTEYDETKPCTVYGRMKKAVEDEFLGNHLFKAIRLSYVVSGKDRFVSYCLSCMKRNEVADVFHPLYRNCVSLRGVVHVVDWFRHHFDEFPPSILNVCGIELVSRIRIADEINRLFDGKLDYRVAMAGDEFFANRPRIMQMRSRYLEEYGILAALSFTEMLKTELEGMSL